MNDQGQMMNQAQMMGQVGPPPGILSQNRAVLVQSQGMSQVMNPVQSQIMNQNQLMMMNQRSYKPWPQQQQQSSSSSSLIMDPNKKFQNQQQQNPTKFNNFVPSKPRSSNNWKGKNVNKPNNNPALLGTSGGGGGGGGTGGYKPPSLNELQTQNRMKARKYYHPKKKFNNRFAPYAPRNTTSFIIRAKKAGGIASLVSPCPVTPAVLPTPIFSPSREVLGDMAKEEWGVDGYGSMKGLIRLRSPGNEAEAHDDDEDEEGNGSSESDVEEHVEVERRLDHDLSRFEMIYPSYGGTGGGDYSYNNVLENRVDDQDTHISQLEEENLTLKERLFLMERELGDLRRRMQFLERQHGHGLGKGQRGSGMLVEDVNEEVVENISENDENENESDGGSDVGATGGENTEEVIEYVGGNRESRNISSVVKEKNNDVCMEEVVPNDEVKDKKAGSGVVASVELIVKEDEDKDEQMRDMLVTTDAVIIVKEDEAKQDDVENVVVLGKVVAKEEEKISQGDDTGNKMVQDEVVAEKDECKDLEVCLEKSIGSGD